MQPREAGMIKSYEDLDVYLAAFELAREVFRETRSFPREERYSLTDQILRSSRSVPVNIAEGWAKRRFENIFRKHLIDAIGSCDETRVWLHLARECGYLSSERYIDLNQRYSSVGRMLYSLHHTWKTYRK